MTVVKIEPTDEYPVPYGTEEEKPSTFMDEVSITSMTAELLEQLGAPLEVDNEDFKRETALIDQAIKKKDVAAQRTPAGAVGARAFLAEYGRNMALDVVEVRTAITNKLLELADCGEIKYELKALELLGKHSDVGLFTERTEINVNYNTPEGLENAIKERVKRLLNAEVIDIKPLGMDLDEELGIAVVDGEFTEVEEQSDVEE